MILYIYVLFFKTIVTSNYLKNNVQKSEAFREIECKIIKLYNMHTV